MAKHSVTGPTSIHMAPRIRLIFPVLLLGLAACERDETKSCVTPPASPTVASSGSVGASQSAASVASAAPKPSTPPGPSDSVHCKALGKRGLVSIGALGEELVDLATEDGSVFAFGFHRNLARFSATRYHRDGTTPAVVGRHTGPGEPKSPQLATDAVYFLRNRNLFRMPRSGEATTELAHKFSNAIAVQGGFVYGVSCEPKRPVDHLIRISTTGGDVETLVDFDRSASKETDQGTTGCDYRSLIVEDGTAYVAHWNGRRLLRISIGSKMVLDLAPKKEFVDHLRLLGDHLLFQAGGGVYRVSKTTPDANRVTELGKSPFSFYAPTTGALFIHDGMPYMPEEWTYEVSWSTGKAKKIERFKALKPDETPPDVGIRGLAVDDECLYIARQVDKYTTIYARVLQ